MDLTVVRAPGPLRGSCSVPGDKSLSHRAVLFAAMAEGTSALTGVLDSLDVRASIEAVRALGQGWFSGNGTAERSTSR
jgi:3-phosphoshikimate 1-carboxyvinyltransferase